MNKRTKITQAELEYIVRRMADMTCALCGRPGREHWFSALKHGFCERIEDADPQDIN